MARWEPWIVVGGAYTDDAKPWSVQDTVNYLVVRAERPGGRSSEMLRGVPGLVQFTGQMQSAPVRGVYNAEGRLFAVTGNTLYLIGTDGAATSLGTIPGVGRVTFAHNQVTGGNQVVIANGQSGYIYDTTTSALTQITDPGFPGFRSVDFADQYIIGVEPFGRYWFHSNLADAADYNTLDRYTAEKSPDRIMQAISTGPDVLVLGERTGQFFYNTGAGTGTWANRQGAEFDRGAASPFTAVRIDNTVIWLGDDGSVYRLNGYSPQRISTHALEQALSRGTLSEAFAFAFEDRGHKCYLLTVPDGQTWCYDVATGEWTRRESYGLNRWRVSSLVKWSGTWIAGDYANGRLYQLSWIAQDEAGQPLVRGRTGPVLHDNQNPMIVSGVELVFDTGMDESSFTANTLLVPVSIVGDVPGNYVGLVSTGAYTSPSGEAPFTYAVTSGGFPAGLTLAADGTWSGTHTAGGLFSWSVTVTDALGNTATLTDESLVIDLSAASTVADDETANSFGFFGGGTPGVYIQEPTRSVSSAAGDPEPTQECWVRFTVSSLYVNNVRVVFKDSANAEIWDSGWRGGALLQANQDAAFTAASRGDLNGTINGTEPFSEIVLVSAGALIGGYANAYNYREINDLNTGATYALIDFSLIPVGSVAVTDHPTAKGYYIAPSGAVYRTSWATI